MKETEEAKQRHRDEKATKTAKTRVKSCQICYFDYVMPYYYVDSKWRLFSIIFREFIEIFIQFYALLLYGGINLFDFNSNSKKLLTQHPDTVEAFAIIIGLNSVCGL